VSPNTPPIPPNIISLCVRPPVIGAAGGEIVDVAATVGTDVIVGEIEEDSSSEIGSISSLIGVSVTVGGTGVSVGGMGVAVGGTGVDDGIIGGMVIRGILRPGISNFIGVGVAEGNKRCKSGSLKTTAETALLCTEINTKRKVASKAIFLLIYIYINTNTRLVNTGLRLTYLLSCSILLP